MRRPPPQRVSAQIEEFQGLRFGQMLDDVHPDDEVEGGGVGSQKCKHVTFHDVRASRARAVELFRTDVDANGVGVAHGLQNQEECAGAAAGIEDGDVFVLRQPAAQMIFDEAWVLRSVASGGGRLASLHQGGVTAVQRRAVR